MVVKQASRLEVEAHSVRDLGLNRESCDFSTSEVIAAALRRAAGFICPCAPSTLVRELLNSLHGLVADLEDAKERIEATLEALVAHGDLLETTDIATEQRAGGGRVMLYAVPP